MNRKKLILNITLSFVLMSSTVMLFSGKVFAGGLRLGGSDRYETSAKISQNGWANGSDYVVLASGEGYADALCAAPIAKKYNAPVILTGGKVLNENAKAEIKRLKAVHVIEMGGTASISNSIENELKSMNLNVTRIGGSDRYATSAAAAKVFDNPSAVVVASGAGYADALSIAPIAASQGMPVLLTSKNSIPQSVKTYIDSKKSSITNTYIVGGPGVISDSFTEDLVSPIRISGSDRFETNVNVMTEFKSSIDFDNLYIVRGAGPRGNEYADALSASALAAKTLSPVILTNNSLSSYTEDFIKSNVKSTAKLVPVGGQVSVPDSLISGIQKVVDMSSNEGENPQNPQSGGGGGSSQSDYDTLESVYTKLGNVDTSNLDDAQKKVISDVSTCIGNYLDNTSYDYKDDASNIKAEYNKLSSYEQISLINAVTGAGINISEGVMLKEKFF